MEQLVTWHQVCINRLQLDIHCNSYYLFCAMITNVSISSAPNTTEYASTGKASRKSDVFSYGVMLLEVMTGKKPTDAMFNGEEVSLREWVSQAFPSRLAHVVDHGILLPDGEAASSGDIQHADWSSSGEESSNGWSCIEQVVDLGLQCSRDSPEERLAMKDVAAKLARIKECLSPSR